jgi:CDP-2,3-bis-(O-geranylgeranyl)-sn-glycerol synthase
MMEVWRYIWLLAPAGIANMVPPLLAMILPKWDLPVDLGNKLWGKRIFGDHKTWRGLVGGILVGGLIFELQRTLHVKSWELFDYKLLPWYTGLAISTGGLLGDCIKSFFKRQLGIVAGKSWFPWDQIDWMIGFIAAFAFVGKLTLINDVFLVIIALVLHLVVKAIGYLLRLNEMLI